MLSMLLLTVSAQSAIPTLPPAPPAPPSAHMRVLGAPPFGCDTQPTPVNAGPARSESLMWRQGDSAVGVYRLLERRIDGCPAPILVGFRGLGPAGVDAPPAPAPDRIVVPRR